MERARVDGQGRVVVPARARRLLGLRPGTELLVDVEDGRVVYQTHAEAWRRVQDLFGALDVDPGESVVDELIAERRVQGREEEADAVG